MTDGVTITGGWQLTNRPMAIVIAGLDCGTYTIANDGTAFVPFGSDPNGLFTPSYLNAVSDPTSLNPALVSFSITAGSDTITVYVPVLMGYAYGSFAQVLRAKTESSIKSPTGGGTGKKRRVFNYAMLLNNAAGLSVGTTFQSMTPAVFRQLNDTILTKDQLYSGVFYSGAINDSHGFDGQLCWQVTRPYPCTITSVNSFIDVEEN